MTTKEIIRNSQATNLIYIVKEALFCKVYEESAWQFYHMVRAYKPNKKYVKLLQQEVVTIGFPKSQISSIIGEVLVKGYKIEEDGSDYLLIRTKEEPEGSFAEWKQNLKIDIPGKADFKGDTEQLNSHDVWSVLKELESFPIVNSTPMQSMQFLMDLQQKARLVRKMPE